MPDAPGPVFPDGRRFAFTIIDDTDVATVENVAPVYALLQDSGLRITKTVWAFDWPGEGSHFASSETLDSAAYREFALDLQRRGFEIASHGATMESSDRATTAAAIARFTEVFGACPRVYANHSYNRENVYWGGARLDEPLLKAAFSRARGWAGGYYQGHVEGSRYWWGDLCLRHHEYVRNLTFDELNLLKVNPTLPYQDPSRPWVRWWFSAADAEDCDAFVRLVTPERLDRLEAEGGVCIVATHLGKRFAPGGVLDERFRAVCADLARRPGWYVPVGTLLDWLRAGRTERSLPRGEWRRMQWRWFADLVRRQLALRMERLSA